MKLSFRGAAKSVTGSIHHGETGETPGTAKPAKSRAAVEGGRFEVNVLR